MADEAFPPESAEGSVGDVAERSFDWLRNVGFQLVGRFVEDQIKTEAWAYTSSTATLWVVLFGGSLSILMTPFGEHDASRLNDHLDRMMRSGEKVAAWGAFPLRPSNLPAAARAFRAAAEAMLAKQILDYTSFREHLDLSAEQLASQLQRLVSWRRAEELASQGRHRAAVRAISNWEPSMSVEQREFLETQVAAAKNEPWPLVRGGLSDAAWLQARADYVAATHRTLREAFDRRDSSPGSKDRWSAAATEAHEALELLYGDLYAALHGAMAGDERGIGELITFIEVDPWCFRSGYFKGKTYDVLKRVDLADADLVRVRRAMIQVLFAPPRMEFRAACRLARKVADPAFVEEVRGALRTSDEPHVARQALWMLEYLPDGLTHRSVPECFVSLR